MSYVEFADIEKRMGTTALVQLTDEAGTGSVDFDVVGEARDGAEGLVNSYLVLRYAVPVDLPAHPGAAAALRAIVLDLVEQRLHARRPPVPDDIRAKRDAAMEWLTRVATGEVELPASQAMTTNPVKGFRAAISGSARVLSRDELRDY